MTAVVLVVPDYRDSMQGHPRRAQLQAAIAGYLDTPVALHFDENAPGPKPLTLTVTGAHLDDVAAAAEFYLGSAGIRYELRSAA